MTPHPATTAALAAQHRRDLTARAEDYRLARAARSSGPAPAHHAADPVKLIRQLVTTLRRTALRLPPAKVPAGQKVLGLRPRTSQPDGLPSLRGSRAVKGTAVTVNPVAARSPRAAGSGNVR
jgi:hypothetical protein